MKTLLIKIVKLAGLVAFVFPFLMAGGGLPVLAQSNRDDDDPLFVVSNFEVWAEAKNAVDAKKAAIEDGKVVALSQLMKRLTLYSSYKSLPKPTPDDISRMVTSLSVQNERNSSTEYLANMGFRFSSDAVKKLLQQNGIPYWDRQGEELIVVPIVDSSLLESLPGQKNSIMSTKEWASSWETLDLKHAMVPVKLGERLAVIDDAVLNALIRSEPVALEGLYKAYGGKPVVVVLLSSAQEKNKIRITVVGRDSVGEIAYKRDHVLTGARYIDAADLAAEVALGMFEQRYKLIKVRGSVVARREPVEVLPWKTKTQPDAPLTGWQSEVGERRIAMHVNFSGLQHWQSIRQRLTQIHGLEEFNIEKLSARGADVSCQFPGGVEALGRELASLGMSLQPDGEGWVLIAN